jgi:hypothetical protein
MLLNTILSPPAGDNFLLSAAAENVDHDIIVQLPPIVPLRVAEADGGLNSSEMEQRSAPPALNPEWKRQSIFIDPSFSPFTTPLNNRRPVSQLYIPRKPSPLKNPAVPSPDIPSPTPCSSPTEMPSSQQQNSADPTPVTVVDIDSTLPAPLPQAIKQLPEIPVEYAAAISEGNVENAAAAAAAAAAATEEPKPLKRRIKRRNVQIQARPFTVSHVAIQTESVELKLTDSEVRRLMEERQELLVELELLKAQFKAASM